MTSKLRLLITGATGFIGRACLNQLTRLNYETHALYHQRQINNKAVTWHACDVLDRMQINKLINQLRPHYLIHLAWIVDHPFFWTAPINRNFITATLNLYQQFSINGGLKAIFIGSCAEYANGAEVCDEKTTPLNPVSLYGQCKLETLNQLLLMRKEKHFSPFCWARLFHLFGPYEYATRFLPEIFQTYLKKSTPLISHPNALRDYLYVDCLAQYLIQLLDNDYRGVINIGAGNPMTLGDIADQVHAMFFKDLAPPSKTDNAKKTDRLIPDIRLQQLNLAKQITFENGIESSYLYWSSINNSN